MISKRFAIVALLTDSSQRLSPHEWDRFRHFKDRRLSWVVTSLSIAIATFLLVVPIIVLYFVTDPNARLALTITFIVAFAIGLSATTSANRDAIFAATAAYSAVLVVFVSGDLANSK
jgi:VIT1/CCC1 family predicted Fe2+/Mn2+ transporter